MDLVFRLTCAILNLTQGLLEAQSRAACRCVYIIRRAGMVQDRLEAARLFLGHIHLQEHTVKRVNTFKYLGSTLAGGGELDAEVPKSLYL